MCLVRIDIVEKCGHEWKELVGRCSVVLVGMPVFCQSVLEREFL